MDPRELEARRIEMVRRLNLLLRSGGSTQAERLAAASQDPRLSSAGMMLPPGQGQLILNASGGDVLPQLLQFATQQWAQQQPWYQQAAQNPWLQGAGLAYMLSQGKFPQVGGTWSW